MAILVWSKSVGSLVEPGLDPTKAYMEPERRFQLEENGLGGPTQVPTKAQNPKAPYIYIYIYGTPPKKNLPF